ncbi:hypothetical protein RYX36_010211 [Vicia faba]
MMSILKLINVQVYQRLINLLGILHKLKLLSLRYCTNLVSMPKSINSLTSLVTLDLCGCIKLENLPLLGNISASSKSVELFNDEGFSNLNTTPDAIGELRH